MAKHFGLEVGASTIGVVTCLVFSPTSIEKGALVQMMRYACTCSVIIRSASRRSGLRIKRRVSSRWSFYETFAGILATDMSG